MDKVENSRSLDDIIKICQEYEDIRKSSIYNCSYVSDLIEICQKLKAMGYKWGDNLTVCKDFRLTKNYHLTNSDKDFTPVKDKYYIEWWNGSIGRLQFTTIDNYGDVADEWRDFMSKLKSYNPVDTDEVNCHMIFEIEDGKRLMNDYFSICKDTQDKIDKKVKSKIIAQKLKELEKLLKEVEE